MPDAAESDRVPAPWWQSAVVYQIYPRSFGDANGDGVGDVPGILERLDYLVDLGVDAVWLSPFYPSPMADFGYDVADYVGVDPMFGTLGDFDRLVCELHQRGIRIILDLVANHSSDRHPWFIESRSSRNSAKRDWYIWRDPGPGGAEPNNWLSEFGGPAWTCDAATGQYYYHAYLSRQPDLNWRNPEVREAMRGVMRFWLDRGTDGFRVDAAHHIIKDELFRDNPPNPRFAPGMPPHHRLIRQYTTDRPELGQVLMEMRRTLDRYGDRVLITEAYLPIERLMAYYGEGLAGAHLPFNFHLIGTAWQARAISEIVSRYEAALPPGAWPNWVLGNHDKPRLATRIGRKAARLAAMLLLTLRGTPTLYYGDEIGMQDAPIPPERVQDPWEKNVPGLGVGRDPARTPMQWTAGPNASFTSGEPWLPIASDAATCNVANALSDSRSLLHLYRALIALRRAEPALSVGSYAPISVSDDLFAYRRAAGERSLSVVLNFGSTSINIDAPMGTILLSTELDRAGDSQPGALALRPLEGVILADGPLSQ